ncbi:hypothetical protein [Paenibacillus xylanexedens]|uniref:hypothetical protein n=1 Tax=Paenibacillus xylanexedens TaxID=528191 RepID=UPI00119F8C3B|nr:hypothetical protein [Paenibacillus xylanexedens]
MYRVVNWDINNDIWGETETIEEAKKIQSDNYFFMTGIEKFVAGKWIAVNGIHEEIFETLRR